jgi:hypothetical protein
VPTVVDEISPTLRLELDEDIADIAVDDMAMQPTCWLQIKKTKMKRPTNRAMITTLRKEDVR